MIEPVKIHYIKTLGSSTKRAISHRGKYHNPESILRYSFIGGTERQKKHVTDGVEKIKIAAPGLKIYQVTSGGDIRISFDPRIGSWSYVGTDIFRISPNQATMNLGWQESTHRVVLHEFGHSLNLLHEHMRGVNWDIPKVYTHFARFGWSKADVDNNILSFNEAAHDMTEIDMDSIMLYRFPCELTLDNRNCGRNNTKLSDGDIKRLNEMFPSGEVIEKPIEGKVNIKNFLRTLFVSKYRLEKITETQLVTIATGLGLTRSRADLKSETVALIWAELEKE